MADTLCSLAAGETIGEAELINHLADQGCDWDSETRRFLQHMTRLGVLQRALISDAGTLAVIEPISDFYELKEAAQPDPNSPVRLSRFSYFRVDGEATVLESPLCHARIRLLDTRIVTLLAQLAQPVSRNSLARKDPSLHGVLDPALSLLITESFVAPVTETGEAEIDETRALKQWEFHDLLFHSRSRIGRHSNPVGGTFRFQGKIEPLPAVKPAMTPVRLPLSRPDLTNLGLMDAPFTAVLENRASIRSCGPTPISLDSLGEFLYRVARVRQRTMVSGVVELTNRPYPNGGASYELELYLVVGRCDGLLSGFYHYDPQEHALEPLAKPNALTEQFLQDACGFSGQSVRPDVLIMISARFGRVSWKYASIAYATILKNVGALYQTMYLVATAMGLAPCALGAGNSDRCSQLLGEDYYAETAVGEFMLGNRPAVA